MKGKLRGESAAGRVSGVGGGDIGGLGVAFVEVETVAHRQRAAGGDGVVADGRLVLAVLEIMLAEGIRGEQSLAARHPPGRMPEVLRVVKNRDAVGLAVAGSIHVAPVGA